jgi:hypothetical protein
LEDWFPLNIGYFEGQTVNLPEGKWLFLVYQSHPHDENCAEVGGRNPNQTSLDWLSGHLK